MEFALFDNHRYLSGCSDVVIHTKMTWFLHGFTDYHLFDGNEKHLLNNIFQADMKNCLFQSEVCLSDWTQQEITHVNIKKRQDFGLTWDDFYFYYSNP